MNYKVTFANMAEPGNPRHAVIIPATTQLEAGIKFERWASRVWRNNKYHPYHVVSAVAIIPPRTKTFGEILQEIFT